MSPIKRILFRAPNHLYNWGLGWLLTKRLLQIEHVGRKSGLHRKTVLEVVEGSHGEPIIASGFGEKSAWLLNITANPAITVIWGTDTFEATAVRVAADEAYEIFVRYTTTHPAAAKRLQAYLGVPLGDPRAASQQLPLFRLTRQR